MHRNTATYLATTAAVTACAVVGSIASDPDSAWYRNLRKPSWNPPNAVFPIAWTSLYAGIAIAGARTLNVLRRRSAADAAGYRTAFVANLVLNAGWSAAFFRAHRPWVAAVWAGALAASSTDLARRSADADPASGLLLAPYAVWTSFATALATRIAQLNPRR